MIRAYATLPGYDEARFDATPWFEDATPSAVERLVAEEWSGKPMRDLAHRLAGLDGYGRLEALIAYRKAHRTDLAGKPHELELYVDPVDALVWLEAERPEVHARIRARFGEEAAVCAHARLFWEDADAGDEAAYARRPLATPAALA